MAILKFQHKHAPGEVMVLIQNILFDRFISQLLLKLGFWKLTCLIDTKQYMYFQPGFSFFLTSKSLI